MSVLVRAADAPARSRVEYWQHVVGDTLGVLDVRADGVDAGDRLLLGSVGAVRVGELTTGRPGGPSATSGTSDGRTWTSARSTCW